MAAREEAKSARTLDELKSILSAFTGCALRATATLHPAYLLRQPLQKRLAWRDFLAIKKTLGALAPRTAST